MSADTINLLERLGIADLVGPCGENTLAAENPATGEILGHVRCSAATDYEAALASAQSAFRAWREVPAPQRGAMIRSLGTALRRHKDWLGTLVSLETGKIKAEGDGEIQEMIDIADFALGLSRQLRGSTMHSERPQHRMYEQWHPLGPVGVTTAFNFPAAVWAWNACIAAVCGDSLVWKPSPKAPLTALAVHRLAQQAAQAHGAAGLFNLIVSADAAMGDRLASDTRLPLLSFTGSSAIGRQVAAKVAARFGRSLLECSGNNAVIVDETADLDLAVQAILFGAIGTAGQRCTSTRRLFVHESRYAEMVVRLVAAYAQANIGDPLAPQTLMGPLIDDAARQTFCAAVAAARACGGEVLYGGEMIAGPGYFVQPTLIAANNDWPVVQRETFAPILYIMAYREFEHALALQNAAPQGLSSALFSLDLRRAERFLSAVGSDCGIANVNLGTSGAEIGGAFGGEKETGGGREAGSDAWKTYMRRQTNTINWGHDLPLAQGIVFGPGAGSVDQR